MKKTLKFGLAALALAAVAPAFAVEDETYSEEGPIGWTPVAIGLATPVQLPWGINRWDVFGLDLNLFYSDAPKMYGLDLGCVTYVRNEMRGVQIGALANINRADAYGLRATIGPNVTYGNVYGFDAGLGSLVLGDFYGLQMGFLGGVQKGLYGVALAGLANVSEVESHGIMAALGCNLSREMHGLQVSLAFNMTENLRGAQIGLVNFAENCEAGFQIGFINIIRSNVVKVLPIVNGYF